MIESIKCGCGEHMEFRLQEDSKKETWVCGGCEQRVVVEVVDSSKYRPQGIAEIRDIEKRGNQLSSCTLVTSAGKETLIFPGESGK